MKFYKFTWQGCEFWRSCNHPIQINTKHFISFDLESSLIYNGKQIESNEEYEKICKSIKKLTQEEKDKFETYAWCFLCYDDINGFCCFESWDDFFQYVVFTESYTIWDFNTKFDCSFLDYLFYFNPDYSNTNKKAKYYYTNLIGESGQRYSLSITYNKKTYRINDFNNIVHSSIAQLAQDYNIELQNKKIEKKHMDYFRVTWNKLNNDDLNYCFNDVFILYQAILKLEKELNTYINYYSLIDHNKLMPLTSGGIAKGILLEYIYHENDFYQNRIRYWKNHPTNINLDQFYRNSFLYKGGLTFINPIYKGKLLNKKINVYDVNSEYPYIMRNITDLKGNPNKFTFDKFKKLGCSEKHCYIYFFTRLIMTLKPNMSPCFTYKGKNLAYFNFVKVDYDFGMFKEEFENLQQFYDIDYQIAYVHSYLRGEKVYQSFVDYFYHIKQTTKNKTQKNLVKLILNSSYGKLGQKISIKIMEQYLKGNVVTFRPKRNKLNEIEYQEIQKNKMSVVNAAYITALARCFIRNKILDVSNGDMSKNFIYCDTDSIHTFSTYSQINDDLGGLKLEFVGDKGRYIKPKTYILQQNNNIKMSAKGINKKQLFNQLKEFNQFDYDHYYYSLSSILVKGGRALLLINKNLGAQK